MNPETATALVIIAVSVVGLLLWAACEFPRRNRPGFMQSDYVELVERGRKS